MVHAAELSGIGIHQLITGDGDDAVTTARFTWDGHNLLPGADPTDPGADHRLRRTGHPRLARRPMAFTPARGRGPRHAGQRFRANWKSPATGVVLAACALLSAPLLGGCRGSQPSMAERAAAAREAEATADARAREETRAPLDETKMPGW